MVNKQPVFSWFLDNGDVLVSIDTAADGVDTPPTLRTGEVVNFIFGAIPTPHLVVDEWGISSPMRFSGSLYHCRFPWGSIQQLSSQDAVIQFRQSTADTPSPETVAAKTAAPGKGKKSRANLRVIK